MFYQLLYIYILQFGIHNANGDDVDKVNLTCMRAVMNNANKMTN